MPVSFFDDLCQMASITRMSISELMRTYVERHINECLSEHQAYDELRQAFRQLQEECDRLRAGDLDAGDLDVTSLSDMLTKSFDAGGMLHG